VYLQTSSFKAKDWYVTFWPWNSTVLTDLHIYTGFIPTQLMTNTSGCYYSL